jgi:hypothetical protein
MDELLSSVAFNINLRRYIMAEQRKMLDELMLQQRALRDALSTTVWPCRLTPG